MRMKSKEFETGRVFLCRDGAKVKLINRIEGDSTKWECADWCIDHWSHEGGIVEESDLVVA